MSGWTLNKALGDTVRKYQFKKYLPSYLKLFVPSFLSYMFYFVRQINMLQKGMKDRAFKVYLLTGELNSWFMLFESLKMISAKPYAWFLIFLSNKGGLNYFMQLNVLPKLSKITATSPESPKWTSMVNWVKIGSKWVQSKWPLSLNCLKSEKGPVWKSSCGATRNIKFGHHVNLIQRV